ncbi:MAG: MATE family efflux transporter, partial [Oscillospiraceae bacterium]|nr:MATE family efflux transporter [Oscillospiraceae bacterium]
AMSGVSIVNQVLFVYNLCLFGGTGGAGIFGAQFYGRGDHRGVRSCFRFNFLLCMGFTTAALVVLALMPDTLIGAFLHETDGSADLAYTLAEGKRYLYIMLAGLPAFALTNTYVSILRVTGDNALPMRASVTAIFVNLVFNWLLIYGKLGFPALGVTGAAIATALSRYVEFALILLGTHGKKEKPEFLRGAYESLRIPGDLAKDILRRGAPLLANEMFWSIGITILTQCYSYRGLEAIAALNISNTVSHLFMTVMFTLGNVVGIMLGNLLGAEEFDRAREYCPQLMAVGFVSSLVMGGVLTLAAPWAPRLYNTTETIMALAAGLMRISAVFMPVGALTNCAYWTLRAGGRTYITMAFDSVFTWVVSVPIAWGLIHYTGWGLLQVNAAVQAADLIKLGLGLWLLHRGVWVNNIVADKASA